MKKIIPTFLVLLLVLVSITPVSAAKTTKEKKHILYSAQEIKDIKILEKRAKKGISDDTGEFTHVIESTLIDLDTGIEEKEETYQTTQKLLTTVSEDGEITNSYVTTTFTNVPTTTENISPGVITTFGSQTDSYSGASYSVKSYSTIYWDTKGYGTTRQFRLTRATGGWTILDGTVSISNRKARLGEVNVSVTYNPSSNSFSYYSPSYFPWLNANAEVNFLGCATEVTIKRGTRSWVQVFRNLLYGYPNRY